MNSRSRSLMPNIWPGFVDALAALLMVLVFLLLIFILSQFLLNEALFKRDKSLADLNIRLSGLVEELNLARSENATLQAEILSLGDNLAEAVSALDASRAAEERLRLSLSETEASLERQETLTEEERRKLQAARSEVALLNNNIVALRQRLSELAAILEEHRERDSSQKVEIVELGKKLNTALAGKAQDLARYRSEFFGRLRAILQGRDDIFIVGDRFVFRSEVLFAEASDEITAGGREQLRSVASAIREISKIIPADIDWVLRIDGHTDNRPIRTARFPSNWELSSARAISVIRFFISEGVNAKRLVAAGFGEYRPLTTGNDETSHSRNRRIELKLTLR